MNEKLRQLHNFLSKHVEGKVILSLTNGRRVVEISKCDCGIYLFKVLAGKIGMESLLSVFPDGESHILDEFLKSVYNNMHEAHKEDYFIYMRSIGVNLANVKNRNEWSKVNGPKAIQSTRVP